MCQKPKNSLKSAFKLALNDLKTCPSRQNQKLQGRKWPYFSNWPLGLRVTALQTFILGTFLHLFWKEIALLQNLSRGKNSIHFLTIKWKESHLAWQNLTWPHFAASYLGHKWSFWPSDFTGMQCIKKWIIVVKKVWFRKSAHIVHLFWND